jgi:hypothetical protein
MTWKFWKAALIRALRTFAQSLLAVWGTGAVFAEIPWLEGLSAAGVAALLSLLTSIATGLPEVDDDV